jgi:hypothetical protein
VLNQDFFELFGLLEKQQIPCKHIRCCTFNIRAKQDCNYQFVIAKIFNPKQVLDGHISTFFNDTLFFNQCSLLLLVASNYSSTYVSFLFDSVIQCPILLFGLRAIW